MNRRHLLTGIGLITSFSGCLDEGSGPIGNGGREENDTETEEPIDPGPCPETWPVKLLNHDAEDHVLSVTITDSEGEILLDDRFEVESNSHGTGVDTGVKVRYRESYDIEVVLNDERSTFENIEVNCGSLYVLVTEDSEIEVKPSVEQE